MVFRTSPSLAQGLLEAAPDGIIIVDAKGIIALVNAQTEKLFGYAREELMGQPIEILIPQTFKHQHVNNRDNYIAAPQIRPMGIGRELSGMRKDGSLIPVEISLSPLETDTGRMVVSIVRDATEHLRIEREMKDLNTQLKQNMQELLVSNSELESFCYSVSHDLRAPLRSLDGFSLALIEDYQEVLDDTGQDYLRRIRASSQHMSQLIDGLLKLSRITRAELHKEYLDITAIARKSLDSLAKPGIAVRMETSIIPRMKAHADRDLMTLVFDNLLSNAIKFSAKNANPTIEVGVQTIDGETVFYVRDNGAGFDMNFADKLFGAFQRLHSANEFEGTGIGLAIVQRVINRHGGRLWAEGQVGFGATFYFTLPP